MKQQQRENAIVFADPERCLGCHGCELACALAHSGTGLHEAALQGLTLRPRNRVVAAGDVTMPVQCRQCEDAPCACACPTGAMLQEKGTIGVREKNCVGCKVCVMVCPFGAISVKHEGSEEATGRTNGGVARKCDLCAGTGREIPACVEGCPTKALTLVDLEEYRQSLIEARAAELAQSLQFLKKRKAKL